MREVIVFLAISFIATPYYSSAASVHVDSIFSGDSMTMSNDTVVSESAIIDVDRINITNPIYLENRGTIKGDIFICDNCDLVIRNSGNISGTFYAGNNSHITQVIKTADDISFLDFGRSGFSVLVQGHEEIYLSDVLSIASGADKVTLENTSIILGAESERPRLFNFVDPVIELIGKITIRLDNLKFLSDTPILSNVSGDALIYAYMSNLDPLYVASTYLKDNDLYVQIIRETDYVKILDDNRGRFLNFIREIIPNDPTLAALDSATNMDDLQDIVHRSVMLNPINLMRPINLFNNFEMNSVTRKTTGTLLDPDFGIESIYIIADDMTLKAGKVSSSMNVHNVDIAVSVYAGFFDYGNDINEFSGLMYGGNIQVFYENKSVFVNAKAGLTLAEFETGILLGGQGPTSNPAGMSIYASVDFGTTYDVDVNLLIKPFLGIISEYDKVLNQTVTKALGRAGTVIVYELDENGIRYDYEMRIIFQTDGTVSIGIGVFFWSSADFAGSGLSYTMTKDNIGVAHKLSIDARFMF